MWLLLKSNLSLIPQELWNAMAPSVPTETRVQAFVLSMCWSLIGSALPTLPQGGHNLLGRHCQCMWLSREQCNSELLAANTQ